MKERLSAKRAGIKLPLQFDARRLSEDLRSIAETEWVQHYKKIHYEAGWSAVPLVAAGGSSTDVRSVAGRFQPTEVLSRCRYFQEVIACFRCPLRKVRLLRLEPSAVIREHVDGEGVSFGVARLHIPIVTNDRVQFVIDGSPIVMQAGECWFLDTSYSHRVSNLGAEPRVHLVLDCEVNDFITGLLGVDLSKGRWRRVLGHRLRWYRFRLIDFVRLLRYDRKTLMDRLRSLL